jgi:uroporphyrinogen-III decarboxylase
MGEGKAAELYRRRLEERGKKLEDFAAGRRPFLVVQRPDCKKVWTDCSTAEKIAGNNLEAFERWAALDWTDELPYLEPWAGVGVYAAAFGAEYYWRESESPATHYRYHSLAEAKNAEYPAWEKNPVMRMVLDSIDLMNEKGGGALPIVLTDTQSPLDTATLIVDSVEFLTGCYEDPGTAKRLLGMVTDLIIEFSREQLRHTGPGNAARPGHIMVSSTSWSGISVSDDNLSFCSPDFNAEFALPYNYKLAEAFGGVAIHSCGNWAHTMKILEPEKGVTGVDFATSIEADPNPNSPAAAKEAVRGKRMIVKARAGNNIEKIIPALEELAAPDVQLVIQPGHDPKNAGDNYKRITDKLNELYRL